MGMPRFFAKLWARRSSRSGVETWISWGANASRSRRVTAGIPSAIWNSVRTVALEIADEMIERLVRALAQVIVIAREERDAQLGVGGHRLRKLSTALSTN